jgi:hypothetical protein
LGQQLVLPAPGLATRSGDIEPFASRVREAKTGESEGNGFAERNQRFPALRRKASESLGAKSGDFAELLVFNELTDIWVRVVSCEGAE